jgi:autotransporter-associated beta strand protein
MPGYSRSESSSELTVEDGGAVLATTKGITLGMGTSATYSHSVLNMNGGVVSTYHVTRNRNYICPSDEWPEGSATSDAFKNTYAFVNCNGGTIRNLGWGALFGSRTSDSFPPNRVTLYERGLTVDSNGMDCRLDPGGGLQAPSGLGVVSVAWDAEKDGKGFVGSPRVKIVGDGLGATAWADFDVATRTIKRIYVTSPGNNYTRADAQIVMNKKVVKTVPCTVGPMVSGGLTKIGRGLLKIATTNTYEGATVVKSGTILLGADDVISSKSKLVLDGGTLDMNGMSQTFSSVEVTENGGSVVNGTLALSGLTVDFDDVLAGKSLVYDGAMAFAAGAKFTLLNAGKVPMPSPFGYRLAEIKGAMDWDDFAVSDVTLDSLPERWQIQLVGNRILLRYPVGTVVTFR